MDRAVGHLAKNPQDSVSKLIWVKVVGIGNTNVGKTCLIKHFCESKYSPGYQPTVGVDYGFKIHAVAGVDLRVHLWDLSGGQEYLDVRNELYTATDAMFLVFDVTNQASFDGLDVWLRELARYGPQSAEICLVGNKTDQKAKRAVSTADAKNWAQLHKMRYAETSSATGEGVERMFTDLMDGVLQKRTATA